MLRPRHAIKVETGQTTVPCVVVAMRLMRLAVMFATADGQSLRRPCSVETLCCSVMKAAEEHPLHILNLSLKPCFSKEGAKLARKNFRFDMFLSKE